MIVRMTQRRMSSRRRILSWRLMRKMPSKGPMMTLAKTRKKKRTCKQS